MTDLLDRLAALRVEPAAASADTLAGDVRRGRRALARRRAARGAAGGAFLLVAGGTTGIVISQHGSDAPPSAHHSPAPSRLPASRTPTTTGIQLVDYTGEQEPGFIVKKVPEGYVLQGSNAFSLDIAKPGDHSDLSDFEHKIVVMLQSKDVRLHKEGTQVSVNGRPGWIREPGDGGVILEYNDGSHNVVVQSWTSLGLTQDQLVELADGVTVTAQAQAGLG